MLDILYNRKVRPYVLNLPALIVFGTMLLTPLIMTVILSFNAFDPITGRNTNQYGWHNYIEIVTDMYFLKIFWRTFWISAVVTVICVVFGTFEAYILFRMRRPWNSFFLVIILGPLLISVVVRTLGWAIVMGSNGTINSILKSLGIIEESIDMVYTSGAVIVGLVHVLIPFVVISVWASLQKMNRETENAGVSLGASHAIVLWRIVIPQIMPGILSGSLIVFALSASAFATPAMLGGRRLKVVATTAYDEYLNNLDWPLGATIAIVLLIAVVVVITAYNAILENKYKQVFKS